MKTSPYGLNSKTAKTSLKWLPLGTWISKFWIRGASSWLKRLREPKFQLSRSYGLGCRRGTNFAYGGGDGNGAWQTENFLLLKSCFLAIKSPKTWKSAINFFHFSHQYTSLIFHMWQVKKSGKASSKFCILRIKVCRFLVNKVPWDKISAV
jgi:hypothetical protein